MSANTFDHPLSRGDRPAFADRIRRHPLIWFFGLAYAYSWSLSAVHLLTGSGPPILGCGPFLAAATVLPITHGRAGLKNLFRAMLRWRVGFRWWTVALMLPVLAT